MLKAFAGMALLLVCGCAAQMQATFSREYRCGTTTLVQSEAGLKVGSAWAAQRGHDSDGTHYVLEGEKDVVLVVPDQDLVDAHMGDDMCLASGGYTDIFRR